MALAKQIFWLEFLFHGNVLVDGFGTNKFLLVSISKWDIMVCIDSVGKMEKHFV
jgi:hypothetical protein